jgi:ribosomal protein S18 acetylase RimI-like enzyme
MASSELPHINLPVELAEYAPSWLDDLLGLWHSNFAGDEWIADPDPRSRERHYFLTEVLPRATVCLAVQNGHLLGFVAASSQSIVQLHVHVRFRRRGIGTQLLDWAKDQSSGSLWLYAFARDDRARAFYERNGFIAVAHGYEPFWDLDGVKYEWVRREHSRD